ncbi:FAD-dependent monooxygenase [Kutzneria viridogrisea]|uniref:FAD-binding domain-containing protein n=2 Tax=Kutzneria TaxID=43356 RepID=W5WHU1_9PSEU|nr:FAD-dependent monooxygenase [Kutzneria albida]AHH97724.1 hypothetical protein KALB_4362 [Kutzneria albida DSM 43870]MBA8924690.1 2-polyprenyl-6-methoxyphenol hydroxylase-like FAD-dependent oxidoreductase [Kutzneria viridogrisea]
MTVDVVVAGGGPVGLMLACELALNGVAVTVVEREPAPVEQLKAGSITLRTMQVLTMRGLLHRVEGVIPLPPGVAGHFAGITKLEVPERGEPGAVIVMQVQIERMLQARALELGVDLRREQEVTGLDQDEQGVRVHTSGGTIRARYLVGCDGGRSAVRKLAGFEFPGTDPTVTCRQGIVTLEGAESLPKSWNHTPRGVFVNGPGPRLLTVEFDGPPTDRDAPVTAGELEDSLERVTGVRARITEGKWLSRYTDNTRQVPGYRRGRVLLAGDAAHVHAPWGGQGLNLGIHDAVNLGWKLAATVHGWAPAELLDTYTSEQHPVGARVLSNTRAQLAMMNPDPHHLAMRELMSELMDLPEVCVKLGSMLAFADIRHDPRVPDSHELAGRFAPVCGDLSAGKAVLVGPAELGEHLAGWSDRVELRVDSAVETAVLIRPDGYVAWAGTGEWVGLEKALFTWFGDPVVN